MTTDTGIRGVVILKAQDNSLSLVPTTQDLTREATMADQKREIARTWTEMSIGVATVAALIFHTLEKKGLVSADEIASTIREAADQIPDGYAGSPRYSPLVALRVILDDPEMRPTMPFPWPPSYS